MRIKRTMIILIALVIIILISACPMINRPPREPKLVSPTNGSEVQSIPLILQWSCEEPDGDYPISYDIYLGKNANPSTIIQSNLKSSGSTISYTVNSLESGETYYWRVVAYDNKGSSRNGAVWSFKTKENRNPAQPSSPSPANNATNQPVTLTLSWGCSDPDGDSLTYDVYFGTSSNPTVKVSFGQSGKTLSRSNLSQNTAYYWKVVAKDNKGGMTEGPVWKFTTKECSNPVQLLVFVEKGSFTMGDTWGDGESNELPVHQVTLTYDFDIGKYEVTFDEYDAFCEATGRSKPGDSGWGRGRRPVIFVRWWDAIAYCNWLSEESGLPVAYRLKGEVNEGQLLDSSGNLTTDITKVVGYRLPTEAEWEYAARGGSKSEGYKYSGSDNVSEVAWYKDNSGSKTQEVGKKAPNELGIYDMSGNVYEWCSDWYGNYSSSAQTNPYNSTAGSYRVDRGGCWLLNAAVTRVANRNRDSPTRTRNYLGFRIARTVP